MRHPSEGWRINGQYDQTNDPTETVATYIEATGRVNHFLRDRICCRPTDHGIFAQLLSWSRIPTGSSNHLRLLLLFGEEVSSVVFRKATYGIVCDVRHLGAI